MPRGADPGRRGKEHTKVTGRESRAAHPVQVWLATLADEVQGQPLVAG